MSCNCNTCDLETCQDYELIVKDNYLKISIFVDIQMLINYMAKHISGQIGRFLNEQMGDDIKKLDTVFNNYIHREKWKKAEKIPKIVLRDLAIKVKILKSKCQMAELQGIMRTMKENPSFEWDYKDRGDGLPRVRSDREIIDEAFS